MITPTSNPFRPAGIDGQMRAVARVEYLLRRMTRLLADARVPYAVVGGNAVALWVSSVDEGATRATPDVDVLVRREDVARVTRELHSLGLALTSHSRGIVFVPHDNVGRRLCVRLILANERFSLSDAYATPDVWMTCSLTGLSVIELRELVQMKLQAYRTIDRVHIQDLMSVGLIRAQLRSTLPAVLRDRLDEVGDELEYHSLYGQKRDGSSAWPGER